MRIDRRNLAALWERSLGIGRQNRMLGHPHRFETQGLGSTAKVSRVSGVLGKRHQQSDFHADHLFRKLALVIDGRRPTRPQNSIFNSSRDRLQCSAAALLGTADGFSAQVKSWRSRLRAAILWSKSRGL